VKKLVRLVNKGEPHHHASRLLTNRELTQSRVKVLFHIK
jgi:hypothetical protein